MEINHVVNEITQNPQTALLAGVGAAMGVARHYVRPELTAERAWKAIALGVIGYELLAPSGELLSEGADRLINKHRLGRAAILGLGLVTTLHLANALPNKIDPFKRTVDLLRP